MGSESSKDKKNDAKSNNNSSMNVDSSLLTKYTGSSCQGVRSETSESVRKSISNSSTISEQQQDKTETSIDNAKIQTTFEWKEGGNVVSLTGSFCGWNRLFIMNKDKDGVFRLTLPLPKGFHQYKFIVDNQWRYSNLFPIHNDNNNWNNYIDTTNYEVSPSEKKNESENNKEERKHNVNNKGVTTLTKDVRDNNYSEYFPSKSELNTDAPPLSQHYISRFNLNHNSRQHLLGNKKFYRSSERNLLSDNNSFKTISHPPHVNLNHILTKYIVRDKKCNAVLESCTCRVRHKFTTVIYYRPPTNEECL